MLSKADAGTRQNDVRLSLVILPIESCEAELDWVRFREWSGRPQLGRFLASPWSLDQPPLTFSGESWKLLTYTEHQRNTRKTTYERKQI